MELKVIVSNHLVFCEKFFKNQKIKKSEIISVIYHKHH